MSADYLKLRWIWLKGQALDATQGYRLSSCAQVRTSITLSPHFPWTECVSCSKEKMVNG